MCILDHDGNINTPRESVVDDNVITVHDNGTYEVEVSSIMTSISPTLESWFLSSDLKGKFEVSGLPSGEKHYPTTEKELME